MFTHRNKGVVVPFAFGRRRPLLVDLQRKDSSRLLIVFVFVFADERDQEKEDEKEEEEESMSSREEPRVSLLTSRLFPSR